MRVSVVIPTYQRRDVVVSSVRALQAQEDAPPFEVVVVVDGSSDGTAEALRALATPFPLAVVEQPNAGRPAACNRGAAAASGELLLFLDDDMEAHPRLLAEHDRSHREGADAVVGHLPLHPDSPPGFLADAVGTWAEQRRRAIDERGGTVELGDFVTGQMSIRRDVFLGRRPVGKLRPEQRKRLFLRVYGRDSEAFLKQVHHSLADSAPQLERLAPLRQIGI